MVELRWNTLATLGWRLGVGGALEYFPFEVPASAKDSTSSVQWSVFVTGGPRLRCGRVPISFLPVVAYQRPPTLDRQYVGITTMSAIPSNWQIAAGAAVSGEYDLLY
jgi:hypothetical protein